MTFDFLRGWGPFGEIFYIVMVHLYVCVPKGTGSKLYCLTFFFFVYARVITMNHRFECENII